MYKSERKLLLKPYYEKQKSFMSFPPHSPSNFSRKTKVFYFKLFLSVFKHYIPNLHANISNFRFFSFIYSSTNFPLWKLDSEV